ncbi:MAG TPA: site-specific integrase, partial [Thermoanaerobaculia bacterium]
DAAAAKAKIERGIDPQDERQDYRQAPTFADLATEYLERHAKVKKRTWQQDEERLNRDVLPLWRHRKAQDIKRHDVNKLLDRIVDRGALTQARLTLALVRKMFNFGISRGVVEHNPAHLVSPPAKPRQRSRFLASEELRQLWAALERDGSAMALSFQLRLLTGQRGGEIMRMRWEDVDGDWWTIPGVFTKNERPHEVFLAPQAHVVLRRLRELQGAKLSPWVFPSPKTPGEPMRNFQHAFDRYRDAALQRLAQDAGKEPNELPSFTSHDLRRTVASTMTRELAVQRFIVAQVLNHKSADRGVTAIYDRHDYRPEKRDALTRWCDWLEATVAASPEPALESPQTVPLRLIA